MEKQVEKLKLKPLNLKNVRKFALEHLKFIREAHNTESIDAEVGDIGNDDVDINVYINANGDVYINGGAGTSSVSSALSAASFVVTAPLTSASVAANNRGVVADSGHDSTSPRLGSTNTISGSPRTKLRNAEFKRRLQNHPYPDAVADDTNNLSNKMTTRNADNSDTSLLTQPFLSITPKTQPKYDVHRDVLTHEVVIKQTGYGARDKSIPSGMRRCWQNWSFLALFAGILPIVQWLPTYSIKRDAMGDIIAGVTVAIMNIPHGMAYGILAGVSPVSGLSLAIFPVLIYMLLGTSRHISIGTFAVISMMTLKVVQTYASDDQVLAPAQTNETINARENAEGVTDIITPLEVATTLAFTVGIVHLLMGFLRLGTLSALLSDPLVNGFTTGAAVHVITSQLKDVLGVQVPRYKGAFKIIYTLFDLVMSIPKTNVVALSFCCAIIVFMTICNELVKPCMRKRCRFPVPGELIAVIGGTLISRFMDVNGRWQVKLVGEIPNGLPTPVLPRMDLVPLVAVDSIAIAIVSFSVVMSMGLTFAKKHSYEMRANQELFALGVANCVSSCFSCYPLACSLSRSVIQEQTGGVTQLASLVSAVLIIMTLLWMGPFFSTLPRCVLAGVIIVALKPMFMQAAELKKFSKQGKLELLTWIATFLSVVIIDIDYGLLIGVCISLLTLYIKGLKPYSSLLGFVPEAPAVYLDINHHRNAVEVPETKIFRYTGSLNFATNMYFRHRLYAAIGIDTQKIKQAKARKTKPIQTVGTATKAYNNTTITVANGEASYLKSFRCLVLDFSMLGHVDVAGCRAISDIMKELKVMGVRLFIASPTDRVYDTLVHSMALGEGPFEIFPTLHDAVEYANACRAA